MKNIDRLAKQITKHGAENIMIHTIPKNGNWLICQKTEEKDWLVTLANPMGNISYNLGLISQNDHVQLWEEITRTRIESLSSDKRIRKEVKDVIYNFKKKHTKVYNKFTKKYETTNKRPNKKVQKNRKSRKQKRSNSCS